MANGTLVIDTVQDGLGATADVGNLIAGQCTAWVNFNGTGTVAIRDSFNVSSITDNGVGDYTVNFSTAMANANYAAAMCTTDDSAGQGNLNQRTSTTTSLRVISTISTPAVYDYSALYVMIFGGL